MQVGQLIHLLCFHRSRFDSFSCFGRFRINSDILRLWNYSGLFMNHLDLIPLEYLCHWEFYQTIIFIRSSHESLMRLGECTPTSLFWIIFLITCTALKYHNYISPPDYIICINFVICTVLKYHTYISPRLSLLSSSINPLR